MAKDKGGRQRQQDRGRVGMAERTGNMMTEAARELGITGGQKDGVKKDQERENRKKR